MPFDISQFRPLRTDEPGDRLQGAALELWNMIPQSSSTLRVREGSSGVKEYILLQEGRNIVMDALPDDLGGGVLVMVVKCTPGLVSGGALIITNEIESIFEFRPSEIPSEFESLDGIDETPAEFDVLIET